MVNKDQWYPVNEKLRVYTFPNGITISFSNIKRIRISQNHTHFLEDVDGQKIIIRNTWLAIQINGDWIDP